MQSFSFIHNMFYNYDVFDESIWFKLEKYIYSKVRFEKLWESKKNKEDKEKEVKSPLHCEAKSVDVSAFPVVEVFTVAEAVPEIVPIAQVSKCPPEAQIIPKSVSNHKKCEKMMFEPSYTNDTIFWCIFQYVYGERELDIIKGKTAIRMMEEKQKIMEWLQKNPKIMKSSNVKFTNDRISSVISEFMCAKGESSFLMIAAYAIYYKIRIYLVDEKRKTYLRFFPEFESSDTEAAYCILYKNTKSSRASSSAQGAKYCCRFRNRQNGITEKEEFDELFNTKCELVQYDKPLNGQTQYSLSDLETLATKLNISLEDENGKKVKKGDLYKKIWEKMEWQM